ncbi:hypothetical protein SCLCIDRAFT_1042795 [Scleroderma citrinum Foug A]|uniref:Uncharacterized protein n=1 Tax=Scleroderma citrinum Foug A TaxID=1036808 RepID=A0A0C3DSR6_9AGAM|nr:hypothetical protein SCLCIDRAFT_1042795 [Scleroderma citrinum Foug A]
MNVGMYIVTRGPQPRWARAPNCAGGQIGHTYPRPARIGLSPSPRPSSCASASRSERGLFTTTWYPAVGPVVVVTAAVSGPLLTGGTCNALRLR